MKMLDAMLGAVGKWIVGNVAFCCGVFILGVFVVTMPRARADGVVMTPSGPALSISICGGANQACNGDIFSPGGFGTGQDVKGISITDPVTGAVGVIPVSPSYNPPTPEGWTPSTGGAGPTPPTTGGAPLHSYSIGGVTPSGSPDGVCSAYAAAAAAPYAAWPCHSVSVVSSTSSSCTVHSSIASSGTCPAGNDATVTVTDSSYCATGYTLSAGTCVLSNASVVAKPSDGVATGKRTGNSVGADPNDPDSASGSTTAGSKVGLSLTGTTGSGGYISKGGAVIVTFGSDGKAVIEGSKDMGDGTTKTVTINVGAPDGSGNTTVTGTTTAITTGTGDLKGSTAQATANVNTCGVPGQPNCKIDETGTTDAGGAVSKGGAVAGAYDTLKGQADAAVASGDASAFGLPKMTAPTSTEGFFSNPLAGSDSCINPTANWHGVTFDVTVCTVTQPVKAILGWFLSAMTAFYAWARFSGRIGKGV